jgi:DNA mismatch repair protein MutS2
MNKHTLAVLEFDKILTFLKQFVTSPQGTRLCEQLTPLHHLQEIKTLLAEVTQMKEVLNIYDDIPIHGIKDIEDAVRKTRVQGFYLEPQQLQEICSTIETGRTIKTFFKATGSHYHALQECTHKLIPLKELEDTIKHAIGNHGEILDTASHELHTIRQQIKNSKLAINKTLDELLQQDDLNFIFQEQLITIRNGRFVLPVKVDHKAYLPGVVHDHSHTKATYFIEPFSVVNLNNELQILIKEEIHEEVRILTALTAQVREKMSEILFNLSLLEKVDIIYAKAKLSRALKACEPILNEQGPIILGFCRHPILLARFESTTSPPPPSEDAPEPPLEISGRWVFDAPQVVPITLHMDKGINTLIITGANAGGKTVALKTLGILSLMAQTGMHIPAEEGGMLPVFHSIFADIGDEQNIEASLSTFSAHIRQLNHILGEADEHSLVLIDELGSGTDPSEGAALGLAILDYLREKRSSIAITTHLTLLKTYAYLRQDVENVSVEFDPVTLKPTYHLVYGIPGMSNALAIAKHLGMPETILRGAVSYLEEKDKQMLELMRGLEQSHQALAEKKGEMAQLREKVSVHEHLAASLLEAIKTKKVKLVTEYENKFKQYLREAEAQLEKIVSEAKKKERPLLKEAQRSLEAVERVWSTHLPPPSEKREPIETLSVGQMVTLSSLHQEGVVLTVDNALKRAEILVGEKRIKTHFDALEFTKGRKTPHAPPPLPAKTSSSPEESPPPLEEEIATRINVIGMTVDEALPIVDRAIDHALIKGVERIEIIHGLGTGRLKEGVRQHLKTHSYVKSFGSNDTSRSGAGVTQVEIQSHPKHTSKKSPPTF